MPLLAAIAVLLAVPQQAPAPAATPTPKGKEFGAKLVVTSDLSVGDRWNRTRSEGSASLSTSGRAVRDQVLTAYVVFWNATPDARGRIRVEVDLEIAGPGDGKGAAQKGLPAYSGVAPTPANRLMLSTANVRFAFEPADPAGTHRVRAVVRDLGSSASVTSEAEIDLVDRIEPQGFADAEEAGAWIQRHHERPQPERGLPALRLLAESGAYADPKGHGALSAFFRALFDANAHLFPELAAVAAASEGSVQSAALELLGTCRTEEAKRLSALPDALRARCRTQAQAWNPERDPIATPANLDELWATFFATGRYAPVRRIVSAIEREAPEGDPLFGAALWSIGSNARQHELVRGYLRWMVTAEDLTAFGRTALAKALEQTEER